MSDATREEREETHRYATGYVAAFALTVAAFAAVWWSPFAMMTTLAIVFALALAQTIVHFRFFLHVGFRRSSSDDLALILFSTLIVILMVSGTLVLMFNLRGRMM